MRAERDLKVTDQDDTVEEVHYVVGQTVWVDIGMPVEGTIKRIQKPNKNIKGSVTQYVVRYMSPGGYQVESLFTKEEMALAEHLL